jgi:hypothetical protein
MKAESLSGVLRGNGLESECEVNVEVFRSWNLQGFENPPVYRKHEIVSWIQISRMACTSWRSTVTRLQCSSQMAIGSKPQPNGSLDRVQGFCSISEDLALH